MVEEHNACPCIEAAVVELFGRGKRDWKYNDEDEGSDDPSHNCHHSLSTKNLPNFVQSWLSAKKMSSLQLQLSKNKIVCLFQHAF